MKQYTTKQTDLLEFLKRNEGLQSIDHSLMKTAISLEKRGLITLFTYEQTKKWKPYPQAKINKMEKGNVILYEFKTLAKDETGKRKVYITQGKQLEAKDKYKGKVLSISETPGAWYIETLMDFHTPSAITYDTMPIMGNKWNCLNWRDIVSEIQQILPTINH